MTLTHAATPARAPIPNFRDIGGHLTADGRRVRTGVLFRSVDLSGVDDAALPWLSDLGIRTVIDLRTGPERARRPNHLPPGARSLDLDVLADSDQSDPAAFYELMRDPPRASAQLGDGISERFFLETYREFVRLPSARRAFAALYRSLTEDGTRPALVHCTTGKDRTGWAVAVLLLALGVPLDAVMADYLRSDAEIREAFSSMVDDFVARGGELSVIEPMVRVTPGYLQAALEETRLSYGSLDAYVAEGLGLEPHTIALLRSTFLEEDDGRRADAAR